MLVTAAKVAHAPDVTSFYAAFAPLCFTLLGLWLVVVQTRHGEWRGSAMHRRRAHLLTLNFALPGAMGLLSLVDPGNATLWRVAFACVALAGLVILVVMATGPVRAGRHGSLAMLIAGAAALIYALIALVALAPDLVSDAGIRLTPLQVEEILLSVLVLTAVNVAWFLIFDQVEPEAEGDGERVAPAAPADG